MCVRARARSLVNVRCTNFINTLLYYILHEDFGGYSKQTKTFLKDSITRCYAWQGAVLCPPRSGFAAICTPSNNQQLPVTSLALAIIQRRWCRLSWYIIQGDGVVSVDIPFREMVSSPLTGEGVISVDIPFRQTPLIVPQHWLSLCESHRQLHGNANVKQSLFLVCVDL